MKNTLCVVLGGLAMACATGDQPPDDGAGGSSTPGGLLSGWNKRRSIELDAEPTLGLSIQLTFDHAAMVTDGDSREDGDDVRIVASGACDAVELDRVLDRLSAWNGPQTTIWFRAGVGCSYALYFGKSNADAPPADATQVFDLWDDFDGTMLESGWELQATTGATMESAAPMAGQLRLSGITGDIGGTTDSM